MFILALVSSISFVCFLLLLLLNEKGGIENKVNVPTTPEPSKADDPAEVVKPATEKKEQPFSSNNFASGSNMNSGNVISERPTSRVTRPPGGYSSFTLG